MNVLLVQPRSACRETTYPLGLASVGAALALRGHTVTGADLAFTPLRRLSKLIRTSRPGWVGVSVIYGAHEAARRLLAWLRRQTRAPLVVGGPYVTVRPGDLLGAQGADVAVIGEGEETAADLTAAWADSPAAALDLIPGLAWRRGGATAGGALRFTAPRQPVGDLDRLPVPDRTLFPLFRYRGALTRRPLHTAVVTSRGCPHSCAFCSGERAWGPWRGRSPAHVVGEIADLVRRHGVQEFIVEDSNFLADRGRAVEIARDLRAAGLHVPWQVANGVRPEDLDGPLLGAMARAGCYRVYFGIETFNSSVAAAIGRPVDPAHLEDLILTAQRLGVETGGYFILGLPGESLESQDETVRRSLELGLDFASFSILQRVPGSRLGDSPEEAIAEAAPEDLARLARRAARRFYLRPRQVGLALRYRRHWLAALSALWRYQTGRGPGGGEGGRACAPWTGCSTRTPVSLTAS